MKYIWINPVVDKMYEQFKLNEILLKNGYTRVDCNMDWAATVKEKYIKILNQSDVEKTVIDMRCPMAYEIPKEIYKNENFIFPDIEPILIHCARELAERQDLLEKEKIITTPCKALAKMGNALKLKNTIFFAWTDFIEISKIDLEVQKEIFTPIPLGYFKDINAKVESISGDKEIREYFDCQRFKSTKLLEMLYCDKGCHNGDGVTRNE